MKFTCLSKGKGFHFLPCQMINMCGFRILVDCPIDLSALRIFSPIPTYSYHTPDVQFSNSLTENSVSDSGDQKRRRVNEALEADDLIKSVPWYKTVNTMHLLDISSIDVILISSPMGILGLPFLTRNKNLSAKIYATEAAVRIGQLMMEDLVSMHMEYRQIYGPEEDRFPHWLKWEELETLPSELKEIIMGKDGADLGSWQPLYNITDVKDCMQKVQSVKFAEEVCYNGTLIMKAFSSGLEIGASNWTIYGPRKKISLLSSSIFESAHAMNFDYSSLQGNDLILFSDFSLLHDGVDVSKDSFDHMNQIETEVNNPTVSDFSALRYDDNDGKNFIQSLNDTEEYSDEMDKLAFICSCAIDSITQGGSVLVPIGRLGIMLQLLEQISQSLESANLNAPILLISSVAEELLAYTNIVPEWLCKLRQQKLYSGDALFGHVELIKEKKLYLFPAVHSANLLKMWQEPCIVFSPHWCLRLGPVVHLLHRWCRDQHCLLILEQEVDTALALAPFKPVAMKVLQCSFLSGMKVQKIQPLLEILQPKSVLFPEDLKQNLAIKMNSCSFIYYSENEIVRVPTVTDDFEVDLATDLAFQLQPRRMKQGNMAIARLKGKLHVYHGKYFLVSERELIDFSQSRMLQQYCTGSEKGTLLQWGLLDPKLLLLVLQEKGIAGLVDEDRNTREHNACFLRIYEPKDALIEITPTQTVISTADETLASTLFEAINNFLESI
ncbi:integrator complex subunit 9 [Macadamia integrifolia]|uniref:integrator complex subunit 9 n=1 Tax=Macadamia integrifolia TaxID=60698 RepID=UPI001C4F3795|nr:integrator complex subunit 9 [Macadamia integrifolia]